MKKIMFLLLIASMFYCCGERETELNLTSITVYTIPFGIHSPVSLDEEAIRNVSKPYTIKENLDSINSLLTQLKPSNDGYFAMDVRMVCDLHFNNLSKKVLLYNLGKIQLDDTVYDDLPELIDIILNSNSVSSLSF